MPEFNFLYQNKSDFVKSPNDFGANGSTLILIENSNNNYGEIKILNAPSDSLLIKIDEDKFDIRQVFMSPEGICKKADYILITREKKKVIFIELKFPKPKSRNNNIDNKDISYQLLGAKCLFDYIKSIIESRGFNNTFHDYVFEFSAIIKHSKKIKHSLTKPTGLPSHDNFIKITTSNVAISYREIVS